MSEYGNDPSIDAAAAKFLSRFTGATASEGVEAEPKKRAPELRELPASNPDESEFDEYEPDQELVEGDDALETEAEGDEAQRSQEEYFELPAETEGAEAEKIPRADAIAAVRQMRQLEGGIAEAITKAETEHFAKQDQAWANMVQTHNAVIERAEAALASIPRPVMPPRSMLDENSPNYDPTRYYHLVNHYEDQVNVLRTVAARKTEAERARAETATAIQQEHMAREHERMARHLPDWKDQAKREEVSKGVYGFLEKAYGLPAEFLDSTIPFDHRLVRAMLDLKALKEAQTKAPEVRRAVQDKAPKLDARGRIPSQDRAPNGQFVAEAAKRLKVEGSAEAAASKWLKEGRFR